MPSTRCTIIARTLGPERPPAEREVGARAEVIPGGPTVIELRGFDAAGFEGVRQLLAQPFTRFTQLAIEDLDLLDQPIEELSTDTLLHDHVLHASINGAAAPRVDTEQRCDAERIRTAQLTPPERLPAERNA